MDVDVDGGEGVGGGEGGSRDLRKCAEFKARYAKTPANSSLPQGRNSPPWLNWGLRRNMCYTPTRRMSGCV